MLDTARGALDNPSNRAVFAEMELPVIEGTPLDAPVTGRLDGRPWHDGAIEYTEAGFLARHLSTACFIVISYLSRMRSGEALSLKRGCVERDHAHGLVLLRGRHWKVVRDAAGDKMPEGEIRADPWVVTEAVATAVAVLERLHTSTWLFPATLFTDGRDGATILRSRVGGSRSETRINHDIAEFLAWVETYCTEHGRSDRIPPDPVHPVIYSARLRRTLAWFIVRRPRGLVAAAIQYGHLRVQMTLGYAGNYASGFPTTSPSKTGWPGWTLSPTRTSAYVKASRSAAQQPRPTGTASKPPLASPAESCAPSGTPPPCSPTPTSRSSPARA
ncbi:hypothetical protein [Streptomyces sp. NPDC059611]|uniref:hypothetical protein n=1 Tax=Streptomyces sp. NPDC059611 TaxID=3346884 RepID=UPI0036B4BBDA